MTGTPLGKPLDDSDVQHLLDLLAMTPGFAELGIGDPHAMWIRFAHVHPASLDLEYFSAKLGDWSKDLRDRGDWEDVLRLAGYCLGFFDVAGHQPACEALDKIGRPEVPPNVPGSIGRLWLTSVVQVSWRLFVKAKAQEGRRR